MGNVHRSTNFKGTEYTVSYPFRRGVDFSSGGAVSRDRFSYLENMYRDYDGDGGELVESIPGFRKLFDGVDRVNGLFRQRCEGGGDYIIAHIGAKVFRATLNTAKYFSSYSFLGTVKDAKSSAFSFGFDLYLLDGEHIFRISRDGVFSRLGEGDAIPYVPTTYFNGEEHEQRNLLTDSFIEKYTVATENYYTYGTPGLIYSIIDTEAKLCAVTGISADEKTAYIHIPSYITVSKQRFRVYEIGASAFEGNTVIKDVFVNRGVVRICNRAFAGCTALTKIKTPSSMTEIKANAFQGCSSLTLVHLEEGLIRFGEEVFSGCEALKEIEYSAPASEFSGIENSEVIGERSIVEGTPIKAKLLLLPIKTPAISIEKVVCEGSGLLYVPIQTDDCITSVQIPLDGSVINENSEITIYGTAHPRKFADGKSAFEFSANSGFTGSGADAINGCKICESFDGRIFLSGNPDLPNTVFYAARDNSGYINPLYFGALNYFNDGVGPFPVIAMVATSDKLTVFKENDDGGGSVFYHTPKETDSDILPKIYPVSYVHKGIQPVGACASFMDETVFLTNGGLYALEKQTVNLEKSIGCRSHNVNNKLLAEKLENALIGKWCGYLVIACGEHIYLADPRAMFMHECGHYEYEWYYLSGIGTYSGGTRKWLYASASDRYELYEAPDTVADGVISYELVDNMQYAYTEKDGKKYAVYTKNEYTGGTFAPLCALLTINDSLMFFGTEDGSICVFNNDMRGVAPSIISSQADFDEEEYAKRYATELHPEYYSFHDRAPTYAIKTPVDDCGMPHLMKNTVKHSMALKCSVRGNGALKCEVGTDRTGYSEICAIPNSEPDFSYLDFSCLAISSSERATLPIQEREKSWVEKQVSINSDAFCAPIGIYTLTYRFTVRGKIKKN